MEKETHYFLTEAYRAIKNLRELPDSSICSSEILFTRHSELLLELYSKCSYFEIFLNKLNDKILDIEKTVDKETLESWKKQRRTRLYGVIQRD